MRFVITCLMSLLVPTLVASMAPPKHSQPPQPRQKRYPRPQLGSFVNYIHEKNSHLGVVAGSDREGRYKVVPIIPKNGAPGFLHEVVVKAHPFDVAHTGQVDPELGLSLAKSHGLNPPPFVAHPTEPHPGSVNYIHTSTWGHRGTSGHGGR